MKYVEYHFSIDMKMKTKVNLPVLCSFRLCKVSQTQAPVFTMFGGMSTIT